MVFSTPRSSAQVTCLSSSGAKPPTGKVYVVGEPERCGLNSNPVECDQNSALITGTS